MGSKCELPCQEVREISSPFSNINTKFRVDTALDVPLLVVVSMVANVMVVVTARAFRVISVTNVKSPVTPGTGVLVVKNNANVTMATPHAT